MIDEMFDRAYQQGRSQLNASLMAVVNRAGEAIGGAQRPDSP